MKSYISKKFPLATRKTVRIFSLRCSGVSIFPRTFTVALDRYTGSDAPSRLVDARGACSKFRLEADVVRTTDDVIGRRIRGKRLAAHERRTFVANVRETRHHLQVIDDGPVCIDIEVVVGGHARGRAGRIHDHVLMLHGCDVAPMEGRRHGTDRVS